MRIKAFLFLVSWLVLTNASAATLLDELNQAKAKWESHEGELKDYSFVISNKCACPNPASVGPLQITVRKGKVKSTVYMGAAKDGYFPGQSVRQRTPLRITIPGFFDLIEKRLKHLNPAHFKIKYDETGSYPVQFEYNDPGVQHEEDLVVIKDLKLLK